MATQARTPKFVHNQVPESVFSTPASKLPFDDILDFLLLFFH